jgi:tetratricopeptide (TPR) repeat protein
LATVVKRPTAEIEPLLSKARELSAKGDKVGAIGLLNQLIGREPLNAVAHNDLAVLYFETGSKELAQVHYERAAEISPGDIGILKNLADFYYFEKGETEKSMRKYLQALTLAPQDIETLLSISHICISVGQIEDSRGFLNRVIEIDPANKSARQLLNELSYVEPSNGRSPSEEDLYARAQKSAAQGDRHGAVADLREIVARNPDHAPAYNDLGVIHYELGEKEKALQFYEQAVRLEAHNATYLKNLADFYYIEQNRVQDALKIYNRLLEADNQDIDCLVAAGTICADLGKADDAHVFIDRVLSIEPWHQRAREVKRQLYALTSAADRPVQDWATPRAAVGRLP